MQNSIILASTQENNLAMVITEGYGNVGIGLNYPTTQPSEKLEVDGNVKATAFIGDGSQLTNLA